MLSMVIVVFLFFSIAATKMPSFTIVASMIIFISFATLLDSFLRFMDHFFKKKELRIATFVITMIGIVLLRFDIEFLQKEHTSWKEGNEYIRALSHNKKIFTSLDLPENTVLFNVKGRHYIEAMFYSGFPAYNFMPTMEQYMDMKSKGKMVSFFNSNTIQIPDYLRNDPTTIIIDQEIQGYD